MLDVIKQQFTPFAGPSTREVAGNAAAVLVALVDYPREPAVILTQRAEHLSTHPGQVSFPGGKYEPQDDSLLATALRETHEEIGLPESSIQVLAELPVRNTRFDIAVAPFLGIVEPGQQYRADPAELDAVFEVPLGFFMAPENLRYQLFEGGGAQFTMPCYHFDDYVIWGFTLKVLVDLLNRTLDAGIVLQYPD